MCGVFTREFMAGPSVLDPAALQTVRLRLVSEQESINQAREDLLKQLRYGGAHLDVGVHVLVCLSFTVTTVASMCTKVHLYRHVVCWHPL